MSISSLLFKRKREVEDAVFIPRRAPIRSIPASLQHLVKRRVTGDHVFIEAGQGKPVIFCHGLFGGLFNIETVCAEISKEYRFMMPYLPMYDWPLQDCNVKNLGDYLQSFIQDLELEEVVLIGNSMGGGAAIHFTANCQESVRGLVLCGSSGLSNIPLAKGFFKRKQPSYVSEATRDIFFDRSIPPTEMMQDVFMALQSNELVIRSIRFTKSATRDKLEEELANIFSPSLLVWGRQDPITPVTVAPQFAALLQDSSLFIINECGHVPTQEKPYHFLELFFDFMKKINY